MRTAKRKRSAKTAVRRKDRQSGTRLSKLYDESKLVYFPLTKTYSKTQEITKKLTIILIERVHSRPIQSVNSKTRRPTNNTSQNVQDRRNLLQTIPHRSSKLVATNQPSNINYNGVQKKYNRESNYVQFKFI